MATFLDVLRNYPAMVVALVVVPLLTGIVTAFIGFDNLTERLTRKEEQARSATRQEAIQTQLQALSTPIESLRRYELALQAQGQSFDTLRRVLSHYDQLRQGLTVHERFTGKADQQERLAVGEHIIHELQTLLGGLQSTPGPGGQALIIKTAPNTFRVIFAVPMRVPPDLKFTGLPEGVEPHVIEKSTIGFAVVFSPSAVTVDKFGLIASAEL